MTGQHQPAHLYSLDAERGAHNVLQHACGVERRVQNQRSHPKAQGSDTVASGGQPLCTNSIALFHVLATWAHVAHEE